VRQFEARRCRAFFIPFLYLFHHLDAPRSMNYWLMKSEPSEVSIDDLAAAPGQTVAWFGVRNYQARNFMRDQMRPGDGVLFYHSSCPEPGIAGIAKVVAPAHPDETQFDPESKYFDPKATRDKPRWFNVDVKLVRKTRLLPLAELRAHPQLGELRILQRGNRLSITPVAQQEWRFITEDLLKS
jgi:predicted RNA-binding protein with PUA-like domain